MLCDVEQDYDNQMYVRISKVEFEVNLEKFKEKNGSNFPLSDFFLCVPKSIFLLELSREPLKTAASFHEMKRNRFDFRSWFIHERVKFSLLLPNVLPW